MHIGIVSALLVYFIQPVFTLEPLLPKIKWFFDKHTGWARDAKRKLKEAIVKRLGTLLLV